MPEDPEKPRVEPSAIIERRGQVTGQHFLPDGDIRSHNVGGERLYPTDALLDLVDRTYIPPGREPTPQIPVDINDMQPDGCVSLESEPTQRFLAAEEIELTDGMSIMVIQSWIDAKGRTLRTPLFGEARYNPAWGWGAEVSPRSVRDVKDGIARTQTPG
jgi:hypothetical protein